MMSIILIVGGKLMVMKGLKREIGITPEAASSLPVPPVHGWVRAVREALGMSLVAFADRLGVTPATARQLESAEVSGSITLKRLRGAADALGCDVKIVFVPRVPISTMVEERARELASYKVARLAHSMALEQQIVRESQIREMTEEAAQEIIARGGRQLWG